jgi:hypothetical protein
MEYRDFTFPQVVLALKWQFWTSWVSHRQDVEVLLPSHYHRWLPRWWAGGGACGCRTCRNFTKVSCRNFTKVSCDSQMHGLVVLSTPFSFRAIRFFCTLGMYPVELPSRAEAEAALVFF